MKTSARVVTVFAFILAVGLACGHPSSYSTSTSQSPPTLVVNIPQIIGKASADVEKIVGKPKSKTKITNTPDQMPGEFREYEIKGAKPALTVEGMMIRYYRDKAVSITLDLPEYQETARAALMAAGIDVGGAPPRVRAPAAERWTGHFSGIDFHDLAALKMGGDGRLYSTVQAKLIP